MSSAGAGSRPDRGDQRIVHDAVLAARLLVEQVAESRDPVFAVMGGRAQHRIGDSGLIEAADLLLAAGGATFLHPERQTNA